MHQLTIFLSKLNRFNENPKVIRVKNVILEPIIMFLIKLKVTPTQINITGFVLGIISSFFIGAGKFSIGFLTLILAGLSDLLDGALARKLGNANPLGAFLDSTLDRYVDLGLFCGIAMYYVQQNSHLMTSISLAALIGASITSYSASRAASLGINSYIGLIGRPQRIILLSIGVAFPITLSYVVWILAILGNATAIYRIKVYTSILINSSKI